MEMSFMNMHEIPELSVLKLAVATPSHLAPRFSFSVIASLSVAHFRYREPGIKSWKYLMGDIHKEYSMWGWKFYDIVQKSKDR